MFSIAEITPPEADSPRSPQKRLDSSGCMNRMPRLPLCARISFAVSPSATFLLPTTIARPFAPAVKVTVSPEPTRTVGSAAR